MDESSTNPSDKAVGTAAHRKTAHRYSPRSGVHYLTFSCYRRLPLLGTPRLRDEFVQALIAARRVHRFKLTAWVVMPEHIHIMVMPTAASGPDWEEGYGSALPSILIGLKKPVSTKILARWREIKWNNLSAITDSRGNEHFWQPGGGFDRNVRTIEELVREVRYIHQNPVERGLVKEPTDWAWSSARWYAGSPDVQPEIDQIRFGAGFFPGRKPEVYVR